MRQGHGFDGNLQRAHCEAELLTKFINLHLSYFPQSTLHTAHASLARAHRCCAHECEQSAGLNRRSPGFAHSPRSFWSHIHGHAHHITPPLVCFRTWQFLAHQ